MFWGLKLGCTVGNSWRTRFDTYPQKLWSMRAINTDFGALRAAVRMSPKLDIMSLSSWRAMVQSEKISKCPETKLHKPEYCCSRHHRAVQRQNRAKPFLVQNAQKCQYKTLMTVTWYGIHTKVWSRREPICIFWRVFLSSKKFVKSRTWTWFPEGASFLVSMAILNFYRESAW